MPNKLIVFTLLSFLILQVAQADVSAYTVKSDGISIGLSSAGDVSSIMYGASGTARQAAIDTSILKCDIEGQVAVKKIKHGGIEFSSTMVCSENGNKCRLIRRYTPTKTSIRLDVEIQGTGEPWTEPVQTRIIWPKPQDALFWTAWDSPRDTPATEWVNPMIPQPFTNRTLNYGGTDPFRPRSFGIPIASIIEPDCDEGVSLVLSPEDTTSNIQLTTTGSGNITFSRSNLKISNANRIHLSMDIISHAGDWRSALGWMVNRYPGYFNPVNPKVYDVSGCGAYSSYEGPLDAMRFGAMGFGINWKASFDYPYMGMFIPPVPDTEQWINDRNTQTSIGQMREYSKSMKSIGFHVLSYFNLCDYGKDVVYPVPKKKASIDSDIWKDPNDQLYYTDLADSILYIGEGRSPLKAWENGVALDPGEPSYQRFLLDQAERHIIKLPDSEGVCIDRMDYMRLFNPDRDDHISWINGKPSRSLMVSWNDFMSKMGPLMHSAGKVIYSNPLTGRIDLMNHIDGFYDEMGEQGSALNVTAMLAVRKPATSWLFSTEGLKPSYDNGLQKYLLMGVFPTLPFPGNDHSILPDPATDDIFLDYGPLFRSLKGRKWVLTDHAIKVDDNKAGANLFEVPGGFVIPVALGGGAKSARIHSGNPIGKDVFNVSIIHPGKSSWKTLCTVNGAKPVDLDVPLVRGCAVLKLSRTWLDPVESWFAGSETVQMKTSVPDAVIRYTLDGTQPNTGSFIYKAPVRIDKTSTVMMAAFKDGRLTGDTLVGRYIKTPPSGPKITPKITLFCDSTNVKLSVPRGIGRADIRYTLDNTEPTENSALYNGLIKLTETATVKARIFIPGAEPGFISTSVFTRVPPVPPMPDVFISDLKATKSTVGYFETAKMDRSAEGRVMSVAGIEYSKGVGVAPNSEMAYDLKPEYKEFVAVVGVDDEMKKYPQASIVFQVIVDGKMLYETRVLHAEEFWHIRVPIPDGSKKIQLMVTDAGDGINCDHGDWANAGFITRQ